MILRNSAKFKKPVVKKFGSVESIPQPSRTSPCKNDEYVTKVTLQQNNRYVLVKIPSQIGYKNY